MRPDSITFGYLELFSVLGDHKLYAIPCLAFLEKDGTSLYDEVIRRTYDNDWGPAPQHHCCTSLKNMVIPVLGRLARALRDNPGDQGAFRLFVLAKRRFRPVRVVIYFNEEDGSPGKLVIAAG